jgi:hypothetical protein
MERSMNVLGGVQWGPALRSRASQAQDQIAYHAWLREEWVVAGVEFYDAARGTGELALAVGRGAPVLGADEVRRDDVLPRR